LTGTRLNGVIAAAATPVALDLEPDLPRFVALCRWLLSRGCDGLNICGTTGEATSLTVAQRMAVMTAAASSLPLSQLMVGTGAAAVGDAIALTRHAAALGFAGALLIPPFYYKDVAEEGIARYFAGVVSATEDEPIDLYLYNFPALSGIEYSPHLVAQLRTAFGERIVGLKDSSGNLDYAGCVGSVAPDFRVFPSNEAVLIRARDGEFAGCISASANVNPEFCARAYREGDGGALERAVAIRTLLSQRPLIASVKAVLALRLGDAAYAGVLPPLMPLTEGEGARLAREVAPLLA